MTTEVPLTMAPEPPTKPRLEELTVTDATPESLQLSWTVPEGQFDHFLVQYKNGDGQPKAVRVPGHEDQVTISGLEPDHKYKMHLYGFHDGQRVGPVSVIGVTSEWSLEAPGWGLMGGSASLRWWVTGVQEAPLLEAEPCCPLCPPPPAQFLGCLRPAGPPG